MIYYSHNIKCITPSVGTGLSGYKRNHTSYGIYDDLYLQSLLLSDQKDKKLLLFSADLIGFDSDFVNRIRHWIRNQDHDLNPASIIFNATHTHCGPATCKIIESAGKIDKKYMKFLEQNIKEAVIELLNSKMKSGNLYCGYGKCSLSINRRMSVKEKTGSRVVEKIIMRPNYEGSVDHSLGVIQIRGKNEDIILFNYACHPTTRGGYIISGDFPTAATRYLRASNYKKREAMFLQGAAGDNKVPCINEDGSRFIGGDSNNVIEYGNKLAKAVEKMLGHLNQIKPSFASYRNEFILPYSKILPVIPDSKKKDYEKLVRERLAIENNDGVIMDWTVWKLSKDCILIALPGEVCHMIGKTAKKMSAVKFPFFLGYSNGTPAYIPTDKILREGGYEGNNSMTTYGRPYLFKDGIDEILKSSLVFALKELIKTPITYL
jgi:hypothetical protein